MVYECLSRVGVPYWLSAIYGIILEKKDRNNLLFQISLLL